MEKMGAGSGLILPGWRRAAGVNTRSGSYTWLLPSDAEAILRECPSVSMVSPQVQASNTANSATVFFMTFFFYSQSIVAGGLELMSYTTLLTPFTSLIMRLDIFARKSYGRWLQSAVIPSLLSTARSATTFS